jgi:Outer membrane protein beta-barrel domain
MIRPNRVVLLVVLVACALVATPTLAQSTARQPVASSSYPEAESAFGWSYLHPDGGGPDSTLGGFLSANYNLSPWFGIVFDASVDHFNGQLPDGTGWGQTEYAVLGGTRFALRQFGLVVPYAHLLAGYGRVNLDYSGSSAATDFFVIQPGAGLDIGEGRFGARVEVSWRRMFDQSGAVNRLRAVAGIVIRSAPKNRMDWE